MFTLDHMINYHFKWLKEHTLIISHIFNLMDVLGSMSVPQNPYDIN